MNTCPSSFSSLWRKKAMHVLWEPAGRWITRIPGHALIRSLLYRKGKILDEDLSYLILILQLAHWFNSCFSGMISSSSPKKPVKGKRLVRQRTTCSKRMTPSWIQTRFNEWLINSVTFTTIGLGLFLSQWCVSMLTSCPTWPEPLTGKLASCTKIWQIFCIFFEIYFRTERELRYSSALPCRLCVMPHRLLSLILIHNYVFI